MMTKKATLPIPQAFFLEGKHGSIFALFQAAQGDQKGAFLFIPPFAEEMNRCRAAVSWQTREFAKIGYSTLVVDPFGTGDSEGELSDASWDIWQSDITIAANWLENKTNRPISLWGFRLGCLLAADFANSSPGRIRNLLLWQPVVNGKLFLTQYLRYRVASLVDRGLPPENTREIRDKLISGEVVEVAGYPISGALAKGLDQAQFSNFDNLQAIDITWFERVVDSEKPFPIPALKAMDTLRGHGSIIDPYKFSDPQIWQLHDKDRTPNLVELTTQHFREK
jgi:exosortase A-associated hydrolase 2